MTPRGPSADNINSDLARTGSFTDARPDCEDSVDRLLVEHDVRGFKLGLTSDPLACWPTCTPTYWAMYVLYESEDLTMASEMEAHLIRLYKRWRDGRVPRLDNDPNHIRVRAPRGPRYFAYVLVR